MRKEDIPVNKLRNGSNKKLNMVPDFYYFDSVEVQMPENMNWVTYHETDFTRVNGYDTLVSCYHF